MTERDYVASRFGKSQLPSGGYRKVTELTARQRHDLRQHLVSGAKREKTSFEEFRRSARTETALRTKPRRGEVTFDEPQGFGPFGGRSIFSAPPAANRFNAERVAEMARKRKIRRGIGLSSDMALPRGVHAAAGIAPGGRNAPGVIHVGDDTIPIPDRILHHELSHVRPRRRKAFRLYQVTRDPLKLAREEARADAEAIRATGERVMGTDYEVAGSIYGRRSGLSRIPKVGGRIDEGRNRIVEAAVRRGGVNPAFSTDQAMAYADVRRRAGAPIGSNADVIRAARG